MTGLTDNGRLPYVVAVENVGWHWRSAWATFEEAWANVPQDCPAVVAYVRPGLIATCGSNGVPSDDPDGYAMPITMGGVRVEAEVR